MGKLEKSVESYLVDIVEHQLGGVALKGDIKGRRFLDRILILPRGLTVYCECKRPVGGRYSRHQLETGERLLKRGHFVLFVNTQEGVDSAVRELRVCLSAENNELAIARLRSCCLRLQQRPLPGLFFFGPSTRQDIWSVLPHE